MKSNATARIIIIVRKPLPRYFGDYYIKYV